MANNGEKTIYELFEISIWVKAVGAFGEVLGGIAIALIPSSYVLHTALLLSQGNLDADADDLIIKGITAAAHAFAVSNNWLVGIYFFMRGFVQLLLVYALFKNKLWAYPAMLLLLVLFVCTQAYQIYLSQSIATMLITVIDIVTIYLVWHEYRVVTRAR
ncbi:MAG: DUF2127 domain-containing protein [Candidatus Pacebacteria bacterium]|nr:DUF2127 domain-containing protein [Candidatus Paceibacterota bacterium]